MEKCNCGHEHGIDKGTKIMQLIHEADVMYKSLTPEEQELIDAKMALLNIGGK